MTALTIWIRDAACVGLWGLYDSAADGDAEAVATAKDVCSACRSRSLCLTDAIERNDTWSVAGGLDPDQRADLVAGGFLQHPPTDRVPSRACYSDGCSHADCRELNRTYVEQTRRVTAASTVVQPHKPNDRRRRCEGQVTWEVGE